MRSEEFSSVNLTFSGPEKKGGHYVYSIVGTDKNGEFNTVRRYSEFNNLRNVLVSRWPGFYIPTLPEKKFLNNQDSTFTELRKKGLSYFIHTLKTLEHLWYSQETQLFLRKIGDIQKDLQKNKDTDINQILEKYKQQFPQLFNQQVPKELSNQIIEFSQYLKKAKGLLQNLQSMTQQIFNSCRKGNQKYLNLIQTVIPDYEINCMQVYRNQNNFQQLIFTGSKKEKLQTCFEQFRKKANSIMAIFSQIKREKQQISGFEEVLRTKEIYSAQKQKAISRVKDLQIETTKIHSGKESLISKIKGKSKQEQLKENQINIQKAQQEEKNLTLLCEVITLLIGKTEIKKFKSVRERAYYSLLKSMFQLQKEQNQLKKQLWSLVLKENHEKQELDNFFDQSPSKQKSQKHSITQVQTQEHKSDPETDQNQHQQLHEKQDSASQQVETSHVHDQPKLEQIKSQKEPQSSQKYQIQ